MIVLGAGLSGLIAGAMERKAQIFEAQPSLPNNHHAVLRFRSSKIGDALGIPFRSVHVLKAISREGHLQTHVTPRDANEYSSKVIGTVMARSAMRLASEERFVAPPDLVARLAELCEGRIAYGAKIDAEAFRNLSRPLISTLPLGVMLQLVGMPPLELRRAPITVMKYRLPGADVHQTIYFPSPKTHLYRATLTGDELMLEAVGGALTQPDVEEVCHAFGVRPAQLEPLGVARQALGKIDPLPPDVRRRTLSQLTREHGVFSLGRYACWRNILLDDVYEDLLAIRRMIGVDAYGIEKGLSEISKKERVR